MIIIKKKKRLVIDYFQTLNRYALLDTYPVPYIDEMKNEIPKYRIFSTFDLKDIYHKVAIVSKDKPYTVFEARKELFQFWRIPSSVTYGISSFQKILGKIIFVENNQVPLPT